MHLVRDVSLGKLYTPACPPPPRWFVVPTLLLWLPVLFFSVEVTKCADPAGNRRLDTQSPPRWYVVERFWLTHSVTHDSTIEEHRAKPNALFILIRCICNTSHKSTKSSCYDDTSTPCYFQKQ